MYTRCEKCGTVIPIMAVRCMTCDRLRRKERFDSNASELIKRLSESELISMKMKIEDELRRRLER